MIPAAFTSEQKSAFKALQRILLVSAFLLLCRIEILINLFVLFQHFGVPPLAFCII